MFISLHIPLSFLGFPHPLPDVLMSHHPQDKGRAQSLCGWCPHRSRHGFPRLREARSLRAQSTRRDNNVATRLPATPTTAPRNTVEASWLRRATRVYLYLCLFPFVSIYSHPPRLPQSPTIHTTRSRWELSWTSLRRPKPALSNLNAILKLVQNMFLLSPSLFFLRFGL